MQLKYTGVLETTKIRRLGYSHRISYSDFVKRYSILVYPLRLEMPPTKETCADILQKLGLRNWKIGKTKLFLKYYHAEQLSRLYEDINRKIVLIQCVVRRWLARKAFIEHKSLLTKSATVIQRCKLLNFRKNLFVKSILKFLCSSLPWIPYQEVI